MEGVKVRVYSTKTKNDDENNKAIMVYYHGGGYTFGVNTTFKFDFCYYAIFQNDN